VGGRIRTAAAPSPKTGQKRACGSFLAARALPSHPRPPSKNHVKSRDFTWFFFALGDLTAILTATLIFGQQNFVEQIGQIFGCSLRVTGALMAIYTAGVHVAAVADQQL
jgi:hypothetical protein